MHLTDGKPALKRNGARGYFPQLQIGMYFTETTDGKFSVWSKDTHVLLDIEHDEYDEKYVKDIVQHRKRFYFGKMLPRIVDNYSHSRLVPVLVPIYVPKVLTMGTCLNHL